MSKAIQQMFESIAGQYDITNDVLSFGVHRLWKRKAISLTKVKRGARVLDLCSGTGDLAFLISNKIGPAGNITALDFSEKMLAIAKERQKKRAVESSSKRAAPIDFIQGDAMTLPFEDGKFDLVTNAFGIRNVDDPYLCLKEIFRVTAPDGKVMILEFGQPTVPIIKPLYTFYSKHLMPRIGEVMTGNRLAYEYLPYTASKFTAGPFFLRIMEDVGFKSLKIKRLFGGVAYIYQGEKSISKDASLTQQNESTELDKHVENI